MKQNILFVGERRSELAKHLDVRWEDGRLAAKPLFDALKACGVNPLGCLYTNWFERGSRSLVNTHLSCGGRVIALGRKVERELVSRGLLHTYLTHPAARGAVRRKKTYAKLVKVALRKALQ